MDPNGPTQSINKATNKSIGEYNNGKPAVSTSGNFPTFVSEHYHKNRASTHGETMRNISKQYKNTTFYQ